MRGWMKVYCSDVLFSLYAAPFGTCRLWKCFVLLLASTAVRSSFCALYASIRVQARTDSVSASVSLSQRRRAHRIYFFRIFLCDAARTWAPWRVFSLLTCYPASRQHLCFQTLVSCSYSPCSKYRIFVFLAMMLCRCTFYLPACSPKNCFPSLLFFCSHGSFTAPVHSPLQKMFSPSVVRLFTHFRLQYPRSSPLRRVFYFLSSPSVHALEETLDFSHVFRCHRLFLAESRSRSLFFVHPPPRSRTHMFADRVPTYSFRLVITVPGHACSQTVYPHTISLWPFQSSAVALRPTSPCSSLISVPSRLFS